MVRQGKLQKGYISNAHEISNHKDQTQVSGGVAELTAVGMPVDASVSRGSGGHCILLDISQAASNNIR
jgi:hypothetical protein